MKKKKLKYQILTYQEYNDLLLDNALDRYYKKKVEESEKCHVIGCINQVFLQAILCKKHQRMSDKGYYLELRENEDTEEEFEE